MGLVLRLCTIARTSTSTVTFELRLTKFCGTECGQVDYVSDGEGGDKQARRYIADSTFQELFRHAVLLWIVALANSLHFGVGLMFHTLCRIHTIYTCIYYVFTLYTSLHMYVHIVRCILQCSSNIPGPCLDPYMHTCNEEVLGRPDYIAHSTYFTNIH